MAGTTSVGGLISGLDTASMISQLMQLEAIPQTKLKTQLTKTNTLVTTLQSLNSNATSLATQANSLSKAETWSGLKTTSSAAGVSASAATSASVTSFDVKVLSLATSYGETYLNTSPLGDAANPVAVVGENGEGKRLLTVTVGGQTKEIDTGDGSLKSVVDALNAPENATGLKATMLQVSEGQYRLVIDATSTGTSSSFQITGADGAALLGGPESSRTRIGADAQIEVSGFTLTSATNTFDEIMPGVSVTLDRTAKIGESATIEITRDPSEKKAAVKSLIEKVNAMITDIATKTAAGTTYGTGGVLAGESVVRALGNALSSALYPADGTSMAAYGLQTDRYGKLVFDEAAFDKAYAADPQKIADVFGTGSDSFATRIEAVAKTYSAPSSGVLTAVITSKQSQATQLTKSIEEWDLRLALRQTTLERTYSAMEVALSKLNSSGDYINSQISSWNASKD